MKKIFAVLMCMAVFTGCAAQSNQTSADSSAQPAQTAQTEDNMKNTDESKKAILVVSFGTSYNDSREKTIGEIEKQITAAYPDYDTRRAFTSQIIIDKLKERDNIEIDNVPSAMQKLVDEGYGTVVIQPTHVMNGEEYDQMKEETAPFESSFAKISYGVPLLTSTDDYEELIEAIVADTPQIADKTNAVVFMGHGTEHFANSTYAALDYRFKAMGYDNVFVGTVEGYPDIEKVKEDVAESGLKKVVLCPLMIVAGDHANNDMAGDEEDSWKTQFKKEGYEVECVIKGLGEYPKVQEMFVEHCSDAVEALDEAEEE